MMGILIIMMGVITHEQLSLDGHEIQIVHLFVVNVVMVLLKVMNLVMMGIPMPMMDVMVVVL